MYRFPLLEYLWQLPEEEEGGMPEEEEVGLLQEEEGVAKGHPHPPIFLLKYLPDMLLWSSQYLFMIYLKNT
jgi:hypothetical protein